MLKPTFLLYARAAALAVLLLSAGLLGSGCVSFQPSAPDRPHYLSGNVIRDISVSPALLSPGGEAIIEVRFGPGDVLARGIPNCALHPGGLRLSAGEVFAVPPALLEDNSALPSFAQLEQEAQRANAQARAQFEADYDSRRLQQGYSGREGWDPLGRYGRDWPWREVTAQEEARLRRSALARPFSPALLGPGGRGASAAPDERVCVFVLRAPQEPGVYSAHFSCPQSSGIGEKGVTSRSFSIEVR
ncbi:hypothetical protein IT575_11870 [bacterium]|nr:hypothetical protein [bacterium]